MFNKFCQKIMKHFLNGNFCQILSCYKWEIHAKQPFLIWFMMTRTIHELCNLKINKSYLLSDVFCLRSSSGASANYAYFVFTLIMPYVFFTFNNKNTEDWFILWVQILMDVEKINLVYIWFGVSKFFILWPIEILFLIKYSNSWFT